MESIIVHPTLQNSMKLPYKNEFSVKSGGYNGHCFSQIRGIE